MAKVCLCLAGKTIAEDLEMLDKYRSSVDMVELRVDCLDQPERFHIRRFPELAGIPSILTVRRKVDGGKFIEGEGARIVLLASGLAYADADRRRNFAYVDLEEDLEVPSLEEAARTFGTRIIRSMHDFQGRPENLVQRLRTLQRSRDEIPKMAIMARGLDDVTALFKAARETEDLEKILLAMGPFGACTRILAERLGSFLSFVSPRGFPGVESAAPGQFDPVEFKDIYHFQDLRKETRIYGIIGSPLTTSLSPAIHNPAFVRAGENSVYVPFRTDSLPAFFGLAEELNVKAISITIPYKEDILPFLCEKTEEVEMIGACNTAVRGPLGWSGSNTDASGFSSSLLSFMGKKSLKGQRCSIIGAGGVARAVAFELKRLGARCLILNRTVFRAKELAEAFSFKWAALDDRGTELMEKYSDIIIQTTSVGMEPEVNADPMELYRFSGSEVVMDLIYKPAKTRFLERAEEAGCRILNGRDMLERQAWGQFERFTGKEFPLPPPKAAHSR